METISNSLDVVNELETIANDRWYGIVFQKDTLSAMYCILNERIKDHTIEDN